MTYFKNFTLLMAIYKNLKQEHIMNKLNLVDLEENEIKEEEAKNIEGGDMNGNGYSNYCTSGTSAAAWTVIEAVEKLGALL